MRTCNLVTAEIAVEHENGDLVKLLLSYEFPSTKSPLDYDHAKETGLFHLEFSGYIPEKSVVNFIISNVMLIKTSSEVITPTVIKR